MENGTILAHSSLLNHLTAIKLALELLERNSLLSYQQQGLVELALGAADKVIGEVGAT